MLSIYSDEYQKAVLYGQYIPDFIVLFFPGMCVITTAACGYTEKNATGECVAAVSPSDSCTQKYPYIHYSSVISVLLCTVCRLAPESPDNQYHLFK